MLSAAPPLIRRARTRRGCEHVEQQAAGRIASVDDDGALAPERAGDREVRAQRRFAGTTSSGK